MGLHLGSVRVSSSGGGKCDCTDSVPPNTSPSPSPSPLPKREQKGAKIHSHIKCATVCIILMSLINHFYVGAKSKDGRANAVFQAGKGGEKQGGGWVSHMHPGKGVLRLRVMGFGSTSTPPLHSSIKMRSGVSKTQAGLPHSNPRLRLQGPSVYLLLTQKRPRGRIAVLLWLQFLLLLLLLSCSSSQKRDLECANCPEWLPPAHNSLSSSERSSRHCRNSSVCGSNTCRGQK